jgi:hypothetical protein
MKEKNTGVPRHVGKLTGSNEQFVVTEEVWKSLKQADALFITAETGQAPAVMPLGPILAQGVCINLHPDPKK